VHNLEHGGLVVQYGDDVPADQVDAIKRDVLAIVTSPWSRRTRAGSKIAYTMWTRQITCQRFEQGVIDELQRLATSRPRPRCRRTRPWAGVPGY
jgi:hypothetical protein